MNQSRQILISLWLLLFAGRGIVGTVLLWAGVLSPEGLRGLDEGILTIVYYLLLVASVIVCGLSWKKDRRPELTDAAQEGKH